MIDSILSNKQTISKMYPLITIKPSPFKTLSYNDKVGEEILKIITNI